MEWLPAADLKGLFKGGKTQYFSWGKVRTERNEHKSDRARFSPTPESYFVC